MGVTHPSRFLSRKAPFATFISFGERLAIKRMLQAFTRLGQLGLSLVC